MCHPRERSGDQVADVVGPEVRTGVEPPVPLFPHSFEFSEVKPH